MVSRTLRNCLCWAVLLLISAPPSAPQTSIGNVDLPLQVESGTPLRLYLTKRARYRKGELVPAKFAEPVWAFDRIVVPAGTSVVGQVVELQPVPPMERAMALLRGDFTPLKRAKLSFSTLTLPDGRSLPFMAQPSFGLDSIYVPSQPVKNKKPKKLKHQNPPADPNGKAAQFRSIVKQQAQVQANMRSRGLLDFVRAPNRREWIENFVLGKLPYHPQWYRAGTRVDAVLEKPLDFGNASVPAGGLELATNQPPPDASATLRLLSPLNSGNARVGDPVTGVLSQPVFSSDHQLVFPEGTRFSGKVTLARPARLFHRGGQLRFTFERAEPPSVAAAATPRVEPVQAQLTAAEPVTGSLEVDPEGTAKTTESNTRFLRPLVAGLVAVKSLDNDTGKQNASAGANANYSGRSLGGFSGFGLVGTAAARAARPVGVALGFYGLAWSVYATGVSRGREVVFEKNSALAIRFGPTARNRQ